MSFRFKARCRWGLDITASSSRLVSENAGYGPGVRPGQESGTRSVRISIIILCITDMHLILLKISGWRWSRFCFSWNHAFKNQITTLQSQAKNRANPNRNEVQANLSLFLEAASGFYTQVSFVIVQNSLLSRLWLNQPQTSLMSCDQLLCQSDVLCCGRALWNRFYFFTNSIRCFLQIPFFFH